jgi:nitroreductase
MVIVLDFFDAIKNRRSIRKYQDKTVENEKLQKILEAARLAPSAMNLQPYQLLVVTNKDVLSKISSTCNQNWKSPIMLVMISFPKEGWVRDDGEEFWKTDAALAMNQVTLAAHAEGLGTCLIGAFNEEKLRAVLGLSSDSRVSFLSPLGYPAESKDPITNRKTLDTLVKYQ